MSKCEAGLIELANAIGRELQDEDSAAAKYNNMAVDFTHYKEREKSAILHLIAGQELLHRTILEAISTEIKTRCSEE